MSSSFTCPFCSASNPRLKETARGILVNFNSTILYDHEGQSRGGDIFSPGLYGKSECTLLLSLQRCSRCLKTYAFIQGISKDVENTAISVNPKFTCKKFPEYIPHAIREDYQEACEILNISPKASAALSRRCMQGIIRDFWQVLGKNLYVEIDMIKDKIDPDLWNALNGLREIGNIGAHMEKDINLIIDIDPQEADTLIRFIEILIEEWYIAREKRQSTLNAIPLINSQKQEQRNTDS